MASGQSNMEFPLAQAKGGPEAAAAGCDGLRLFTVAKATSLTPKDDVTGQWARVRRRRRPSASRPWRSTSARTCTARSA